jgi:hypothetical protein
MGSCHVSLFYAILRKNSAFIYTYMIHKSLIDMEKSPLNAKTTKMCSYHLQRNYVKQHFNINGFLNRLIDDQTVKSSWESLDNETIFQWNALF